MDADEPLNRATDPLAELVRQDLDRFSVSELEERTRTLDAELARTKRKIEGAVNHRASADELFKR